MKIAILGTRGIPNQYGGFEQLAEHLSVALHKRGHDVYVYSSSAHAYKKNEWQGIKILHQYDPEKRIGTAGQFIYDLNCILDSRRRGFDVILNLGYTSSAVWLRLIKGGTKVVTNMDGLEWKRTKYSKPVQAFLRYSERLAVKLSDRLVADSTAIQNYLKGKFWVDSHFVPYGADLVTSADEQIPAAYGLRPRAYNMLIARMEPENNIEMILEGACAAPSPLPFVVVGNTANRYGTYIRSKFGGKDHIRFLGPVYDAAIINSLRFYCRIYFHGHSVGGTNPSLIEAMGNGCVIAAHDNEFNRAVLGDDAFYFDSVARVENILARAPEPGWAGMTGRNLEKVRTLYSWQAITDSYEKVLEDAVS